MIEQTHTLTLAKQTQRRVNPAAVAKQTRAILTAANSKNLATQGWVYDKDESDVPGGFQLVEEIPNPDDPTVTLKTTHLYLRLDYRHAVKEPDKNALAAMCRRIYRIAVQVNYGGWTLCQVNGDPYTPPEEGAALASEVDQIGYADLEPVDDWSPYYDHLYGLDPQIELLMKAVQTAHATGWNVRSHTVLVGPPGCGKTQVAKGLKDMYGPDAVMVFDGPATTNVGIQQTLAELEILPRVIIVEEMEKAPEGASQVFLGMMDDRAEIRKTTARTKIQRDTRVLCIATVNSYTTFKKLHYGALSSRFNNPVGFKRPSREQLAMILQRETTKYDLDERWIQPCLDYCFDRGITDPRRVITLCLNGAEGWLNGEYKKMLDATSVEDIDQVADWSNIDLTLGEEEGA